MADTKKDKEKGAAAATIAYTWHPNVRRYRGSNGRFVADSRIRSHVNDAASQFSSQLYDRTKTLKEGFTDTDFYEWARTTRKDIKDFHFAVIALALGGVTAASRFASINSQVWATMEQSVGRQLTYFDNYAFSILYGGAVNVDPARAAMYPMAGYGMWENAVRIREATASGFDEEQRITEPGNNCDTCLEQEDLGWQPIGTLNEIGDSECGANCRCYFDYRNVAEEALD